MSEKNYQKTKKEKYASENVQDEEYSGVNLEEFPDQTWYANQVMKNMRDTLKGGISFNFAAMWNKYYPEYLEKEAENEKKSEKNKG